MNRLIVLLLLVSPGAFAQVYRVGVASTNNFLTKLPGEITIADSTVTFNFNGQKDIKRIQNKATNVIYLTDGTVTDRLTFTPMVGKVKGFSYTVSILYSPDRKYSSQDVVYYAISTE